MSWVEGGQLGIIALGMVILGYSLWGALGMIDRHMNRRRRWDDEGD